jgi:hypothetical protein
MTYKIKLFLMQITLVLLLVQANRGIRAGRFMFSGFRIPTQENTVLSLGENGFLLILIAWCSYHVLVKTKW